MSRSEQTRCVVLHSSDIVAVDSELCRDALLTVVRDQYLVSTNKTQKGARLALPAADTVPSCVRDVVGKE